VREIPTRRRTDALADERKLVTVLFADLHGSTELVSDLDPEAALDRLTPALDAMSAAIHHYGGIVLKTQGDGVLAVFGAPAADADHALRACLAALETHERLSAAGTGVFTARIGLNSGEVVVHRASGDLFDNYDATGGAVNLAARLEAMATPGSTLLSGETFALARGRIEARSLGPATVRGFANKVELYELVGRHPGTRWQARAALGLTTFVGRAAEIVTARGMVERVVAGEGQMLAIVGEPGVGKSRLAHELVATNCSGWPVWEIAADPTRADSTLGPIRDLILRWIGAEAEDDQLTVARKLDAALSNARSRAGGLRAALGSLLQLPIEDRVWRSLEPAARRRRVRLALCALMAQGARRNPRVILVEDAHWLDQETEAFLDTLQKRLARLPIFLLVTARPPLARQWTSGVARLELPPLAERAAAELVDTLIGVDATTTPLKTRLLSRAGGVPLFLEEAVRGLAQDGALQGEPGQYVFAGPAGDPRVPPTVHGVIAARIDALHGGPKRLLQLLASMGNAVPVGWLEILSEGWAADPAASLRVLEESALVTESKPAPDRHVVPQHDLVREVAYGSLLAAARRDLHGRLLSGIEKASGDRLGEYVDQMCRHAELAELWPRAVRYAAAAAENAIERSAYSPAVAFCERSIAALDRLPRDPDTDRQRIDARLRLRSALGATADLDRALAVLDEADRLAVAIDDQHRRAAVAAQSTSVLNFAGTPKLAIARGREALAIAREVGDLSLIHNAELALGQAFYAHGSFAEAVATLEPATEALRQSDPGSRLGTTGTTALLCSMMLATACACLGEFGRADESIRFAAEIARDTGRPYDAVAWRYGAGFTAMYRGEIGLAISLLEPALSDCRRNEIALFLPVIGAQLGAAYAAVGRLPQGILLLQETIEVAARIKHHAVHAGASAALALIMAGGGRGRDALPHAEASLATACAQGLQNVETLARRAVAAVMAQSGDFKAAFDQLSVALSLSERIGTRPTTGQILVMRGRLAAISKLVNEARQDYEQAAALFQQLGMLTPATRAAAALQELTTP
jgi:class 3 adenylate cyclase/tetratricopeptide (TPR) repeat protein